MFVPFTSCLPPLSPGPLGGITLSDADGDGQFEVLLAGAGGPNHLLKWVGGRLREVASPILAATDQSTIQVAAADMDGDGCEEIYLLNDGRTPDRLLRRGADGQWFDLLRDSFQESTHTDHSGSALENNLAWSLAAIDRRGMGRFGILAESPGSQPRFLEIGPDGSLVNLARSVGLGFVSRGGLIAAPLLGPATDLLAFGAGANALFRNLGDGLFEKHAVEGDLADAMEVGVAAAVVCVPGSPNFGLCIGNHDGPHRLFAREPRGPWKDQATPAMALPSTVRALLAADFDNDGHEEIFFGNAAEPNRLFRLEEGGPVLLDSGQAADGNGDCLAAAAADIDGDGILELLIARRASASAPLAIFKAAAARGNGWLRVRPQTRFGAPARGARVLASIEGRIAVKLIASIGEPVAHFGLGQTAIVEWVHIVWPDGAELRMPQPDCNCTYSVPYPYGR